MIYEWDPEKNEKIKEEHGISFDQVVELIKKRFVIDIIINPSKKYKGQKVFLIKRGVSVFMVPFEKRNKRVRLITAFYSKSFTDKYLR